MRMRLWVLMQASLLPFLLQAQQPPLRDPSAIATVQMAIQAMGGQAAVAQIKDSVAQGHTQPVAGGWVSQAGDFVWKNADSEFRYESVSPSGRSVWLSGHGHPKVQSPGGIETLPPHTSTADFPSYLPALVLVNRLGDPRYQFTVLAPAQSAGGPAIGVRTLLNDDPITSRLTMQDWYFDSNTLLPIRVEYNIPEHANAAAMHPAAEEFSDYQVVSGILVPFKIVFSFDGHQMAVNTVSTTAFNTGINPSDFDLP
jgi:hypothetical protein